MATTFAQRSKALNLWSPDETERFKLSTVNSNFGREAIIDFAGGSGTSTVVALGHPQASSHRRHSQAPSHQFHANQDFGAS